MGRGCRQHRGLEPRAERRRVRREPLRGAVAVAVEAVGPHREVLALQPLPHGDELVGCDLERARLVERQRGLAQHRRQHGGLEHHAEREVPGEAHADGPDARPATLAMSDPRQAAQPQRDRARCVRREGTELGAHARAPQHREPSLRLGVRAVAAEQRRQVDGEPGLADPAGEPCDVRADAGHLGQHDDGRAVARHVHRACSAIDGEVGSLEVGQGVVMHPTTMDVVAPVHEWQD